jgi:dienelactone hydrolase
MIEPRRIAAVGYCFGARYVLKLLSTHGIDAGFIAHPSFITPDEFASVQAPISVAAAGKLRDLPPRA